MFEKFYERSDTGRKRLFLYSSLCGFRFAGRLNMSRRGKIRLWAFGLALVFIGGGFLIDLRLSLNQSGTRLEYVYQRALGDLTDEVSGMGRTLEKARYAGTPAMQSVLSAQLLEQSGGAKAALGSLPFSMEKTERISRFLSQVGDYALALTRKSFSGEELQRQDLEGFSTLQAYAGKLEEALTGIQARLTAEGAQINRLESLLNNVDEIEELALLDDDFDSVAKEFADFPALLYDGPFSDHIPQREPLYLKGEGEISREQAGEKAAAFLGCAAGDLEFTGEGGGQLPVFSFAREGEQIRVTRQGGEIAYYKKENSGTGSLSYEEALKAAKKALEGLGLPPLQESYYVSSDGLCTVNFHTKAAVGEEEALCYPDLIKVTVELEKGGMVEYDGTGFLMNCRERSLSTPALSAEEAAEGLSPLLQVESTRLAVIPTPGLDEVLCWEFSCKGEDGRRVLSYVNTETGLEEQLYLLQIDDSGVLAS